MPAKLPPSVQTKPFRAIVVGVDHYPMLADAELSGCVNDAIEIRRFLVEHVGVSPANIRLLLSGTPISEGAPADDPGVLEAAKAHASAHHASSANVRDAFQKVLDETQAGDEVIVFFASHGVRISNPVTRECVYGFAPADLETTSSGFANLILGKELNTLTHALTRRGAHPTIIADTCHSASSVRAIVSGGKGKTRRLTPPNGATEWTLSGEAWKAFVEAHPALGKKTDAATQKTRGSLGASGWLGEDAGAGDWVMLAACRDTEVAGEYAWVRETSKGPTTEPHGMLTGSLLVELKNIPKDAIATLRWKDVYPSVRSAVQQLAAQSPTLEGRPERPVFGGDWKPFQPGFSVQPTNAPDVVAIAAGSLHGLDEGAEVAIFPPDTADFGAALKAGIKPASAVVKAALPASSTARLTSGGPILPMSRAILTKPSPKAKKVRVRVWGDEKRSLSAATLEGMHGADGAADFLQFVDEDPADVDVRPWKDDRWVITPYIAEKRELSADDVIAYVGKVGAAFTIPEKALGYVIGSGLVHWARYVQVRDRRSLDSRLQKLVTVTLRAGTAANPDKEDSKPLSPNTTGVYEIPDQTPLWVEVRVEKTPPQRLFVGIILCSNDGNVDAVWPPQGGDPTVGGKGADEWNLPIGQSLFVGSDQNNAGVLSIREDQQHSEYTYKVIAVSQRSGMETPDLSGLTIKSMVQDTVDAELSKAIKNRGGFVGSDRGTAKAPTSTAPLWYAWDLRVCVGR